MNRDTRTALMDLAEHTVRSRGFDGFSYADLAEAIGIRKASIHYHFPTKAKLSEALIERYQTSLQQGLTEIDAAMPALARASRHSLPCTAGRCMMARPCVCALPFRPAAKACPTPLLPESAPFAQWFCSGLRQRLNWDKGMDPSRPSWVPPMKRRRPWRCWKGPTLPRAPKKTSPCLMPQRDCCAPAASNDGTGIAL